MISTGGLCSLFIAKISSRPEFSRISFRRIKTDEQRALVAAWPDTSRRPAVDWAFQEPVKEATAPGGRQPLKTYRGTRWTASPN
jgi:hypothetical protein